jgi:hypothetical protein
VRHRGFAALVCGLTLGLAHGGCNRDDGEPAVCNDDDVDLTIFEDRIAPLLRDDNPSTCNECHLAGIDLGLYAKGGDECTTLACMVEVGIVDLEAPEDSLVLDWMMRGSPDSTLVTSEVRQQERDGMLEWIESRSACSARACPTIDDPCGRGSQAPCETPDSQHDLPPRGFDDPGDCSDVTVERAFGELVYSWRGRCFPCHYDSQSGAPDNAPRFIADGECNVGALATMRNVLELGLVDPDDTDRSLLLRKPLAEAAGGVAHEGGDKFFDTADGAYADFRTWVELYRGCQAASDKP